MTDQEIGRQQHRFDGVLDPDALAAARQSGIPLAYCPVQIGWVPLSVTDDAEPDPPLCWRGGRAASAERPPVLMVPDQSRFAFRPWTEDDLPLYRGALTDPDLWHYMPEEAPQALDDADIRALISLNSASPHHLVRAILHDGTPIGQVRLEFLAGGARAELSYWLAGSARGHGFGPQAVARFLDETLPRFPDLTVLVARVHPDNRASARVLERCGLRPADRAETGLDPRGRDRGNWPVFLRALS